MLLPCCAAPRLSKRLTALNSAPDNCKVPFFIRWLTILLANNVFIQHYFTHYFLAIWIKQLNNCKSLVHTYACQLLGLMMIKPEDAKADDKALPMFYVVLFFVKALSRVWFIGHFNWRMRPNPNFGKGTCGLKKSSILVTRYLDYL
jgi:hypothetical protein